MAAALPPAAGVRAAKQARSLHKQQALLAAGRTLLKTHDLPALSVAQVAAAAGVAVGSFYARFDDKNAWFAALAREATLSALDELQRLLASSAMRRAAPARKVALLMAWLVQVHREHQGIFRASVSDPARTALYWEPFGRICAQVDAWVHELLAPDLAELPPAVLRRRVSVASQMVFATLAQAVLHDAGPLRLHDPALERELARVFLAAIGSAAA